ncbi:alkylation response protein AidB-like acyl-CoA dehydrogenase [Paenibacillus phyllosphaerae]|uniref:Acyl-CoA dehydrogenase n=1 Tax=Paenibacillus phyllosphaerae TaxID=274593 RepID=A0A7W5AX07_9BACL|nr:acyl-CoA dehydrogenase family protein [Paenibacillus phyllosphaerae]MBB3110034.1 alkylation response protein AidB-like acyl-CoA dehydrogenase [Paenibacillus phyllosphaerae]
MELRFTEEQLELQRIVRQFARDEVAPAVGEMEAADAFPYALVRKMAASGLMGIPIPKEQGGRGGDFISYILAINELSRVSAAVGVILSVHTSVGTLPIQTYGSTEQRERFVKKLATGEWIGAFALTEPHAGSDAGAIRTTAVKQGDHYVVNGSKLFITNAEAAELFVLFAVTDRSKGARGITAFLVERGLTGFQIGRKEKKMGLHGSSTCELVLDGVRVHESKRLGAEGEGFAIAKGTLDGGRIGIGAQALGIAEAALQLMQERLLTAKGEIAIKRGKVAHEFVTLANLTAQVEAARLLVYHAAYLRQSGIPCTKEASMAKMYASDTAMLTAGEAVRLLSRSGQSSAQAERLFRDAKVTQIYEGTNEIHRIVIGNQLLKS